ncbi:hypothetical protein MPDQ_006816, partial [Monascus purpureus]
CMVNLSRSAILANTGPVSPMEIFAHVISSYAMAILLQLLIGNSLGGIRNIGNTQKRILDFSTCRTGMPSFRMLCLDTMMNWLRNVLSGSNLINRECCN